MRTQTEKSIEERIDRLHAGEIVDFHFDLLIDLYEKRDRPGALVSHFFPEFEVGDIGVLGMKMNTLEGVRRAVEHGTRNYFARISAHTRRDPDSAHARAEQIASAPVIP